MTKAASTEDILIGETWRQLFDCEPWRVGYLVHFGECDDAEKRQRSRLLLSGLRRRESRHEVCKIALEETHPWLDQLLGATEFLPEDKNDIPLFLAITKQWDRYLSDFAGTAPLISSLSKSDFKAERVLKSLIEIEDASGVILLLKLYTDGSLLSSNVEEALRLALLSQNSIDCIECIYEYWSNTRNERIAALFKELAQLRTADRRLKVLVELKVNGYLAQVQEGDLYWLIENLDDCDHEITAAAKRTILSLDDDQDSLLQEQLFSLLFDDECSDALIQISSQLSSRPKSKTEHVLFCVLANMWDELANLDPDGNILTDIYKTGTDNGSLSETLKVRLADNLRSSARSEWVSNLHSVKDRLKLSEMTDLDWQLLQNSLSASLSWSELWRLIPVMPALSARRFLRRLIQVGWRPEDKEDLSRFEKLIYFAKRLNAEQVPIWSGLDYLGAVDLGGPLFGNPGDGGVESMENRFGFSNDGSAFYFADRSGSIKVWNLPSLLNSKFVVADMNHVSSVSLSPTEPLLAFSDGTNIVSICDLLDKRVVSKCSLPDDRLDHVFSNLRFSESGSYLTACLRSPGRNVVGSAALWNLRSPELAPAMIPPRALVSGNDEFLVYRTHGMIHLTTIDRKSSPMDYADSFFRIRDVNFLPDSSGVVMFERANVHLHEIDDFSRKQTVILPHELSVYISDQQNYRMLCLHEDYSFSFLTLNKSEMQFAFRTESYRQILSDENVWLAPVHERQSSAGSRAVLQMHKDARNTHLAIIHAAGSISFWASPYSMLSRKSPILFSKADREKIRAGLVSSTLGEAELAWLRFISELSGSSDHYAVELSETNAITINDVAIELK